MVQPSFGRPDGDEASFIFISYARADRDYVDDLTNHLASHGVDAWIDDNTDHGQRWPKEIRNRIDACAAVVVAMTPASEESEWVEREIVRAQQMDRPVLPLLRGGLPFFELNTTLRREIAPR